MATASIKDLNLFERLAKIADAADVIVKEKQGYNYSYADIASILAQITANMTKYRVYLYPGIVPSTLHIEQVVHNKSAFDKTGKPYVKTNTEMSAHADMIFTWINLDNPEERLEVPWVLVGAQEDPSQSVGSGITYCTRYFLTSFFNIAQVNSSSDVDKFRSQQKEAAEAEDRAIAQEIIDRFDKIIKAFCERNPARKDEAKKFVSGYATNANYKNIKEPRLAAKLLEDFTHAFIEPENETQEAA